MKNKKLLKHFKKIFFILMSACIVLSGCQGPPRLKNRAIILALGVDIADDGKYVITAQKFAPKGGGSSEGIDSSKSNDAILNGEGKSITEAINQIQSQNGKDIFLGNNSYIIFGKELSKQGIEPVLNFFNASYEQRPTANVIISQTTAKDIITNQVTQDIMPAFSLGLVTQKSKGLKSVGEISLLNVMSDILSEKRAPYIPIAEVGENDSGDNIFKINGTAVFDGDKYAKEISDEQSQGLLWTKGEIKDVYIVVENEDEIYAIKIDQSKASKSTQIKDNEVIFNFDISASGELQETIGATSQKADENFTDKVQKLVKKEIEKQIFSVINSTAIEEGLDVLDLTSTLRQNNKNFWKQNQDDYKNILKNATYNINIDFKIDKIGLDFNKK